MDACIPMHRLKARAVEVPVRMYGRAEGKSSITAFRAVYYMVKQEIAPMKESSKIASSGDR